MFRLNAVERRCSLSHRLGTVPSYVYQRCFFCCFCFYYCCFFFASSHFWSELVVNQGAAALLVTTELRTTTRSRWCCCCWEWSRGSRTLDRMEGREQALYYSVLGCPWRRTPGGSCGRRHAVLSLARYRNNTETRFGDAVVGRYRSFLCPVSRLASLARLGRDLPYSDSP